MAPGRGKVIARSTLSPTRGLELTSLSHCLLTDAWGPRLRPRWPGPFLETDFRTSAGQLGSRIKREPMGFCSLNRIHSRVLPPWVWLSLQRLHLVRLQTWGSWNTRFIYSFI